MVTSRSPLLLLGDDTTTKACTHAKRDHNIGKTPTAQLGMFVCTESVYGIATAYALGS